MNFFAMIFGLITALPIVFALEAPICMLGSSLEAGKAEVSIKLEPSDLRSCVAAIDFQNPTFLPLTYWFQEKECAGVQVASFRVPRGVPNGNATITWQCSGLQKFCQEVQMVSGTSDPTLSLERTAKMGCIPSLVQTHTTVYTITKPSTPGTNIKTTDAGLISIITAPTNMPTSDRKSDTILETSRNSAETPTGANQWTSATPSAQPTSDGVFLSSASGGNVDLLSSAFRTSLVTTFTLTLTRTLI